MIYVGGLNASNRNSKHYKLYPCVSWLYCNRKVSKCYVQKNSREVQYMHEKEFAYMNKTYVESKISKLTFFFWNIKINTLRQTRPPNWKLIQIQKMSKVQRTTGWTDWQKYYTATQGTWTHDLWPHAPKSSVDKWTERQRYI